MERMEENERKIKRKTGNSARENVKHNYFGADRALRKRKGQVCGT